MAKEENIFTRLTSLFRAGPVVKRRVKEYKPSEKTTSAYELFKKTQSQVYSTAMSAYGSYDRMCVDLNTLIAVPDKQGFFTLNKLMEMYPDGEKFLVYAYDNDKKKIVPAWAHHPRSSGFRETVKITFDDGSTLICTDNHQCMMKDGTYKNAGDLLPNDSMMPFYRKQFHIDGKFAHYRNVYTKSEHAWHGWESEHKLVAKFVADCEIKENEHVHHIDFDAENNHPNNLLIMDAKEHLSMHSRIAIKTEVSKKKLSESQKKNWENNEERRQKLVEFNKSEKIREKRKLSATSNNVSKNIVVREKISIKAKERYTHDEAKEKTSSAIKLAWEEGRIVSNEKFTNYWSGRKRSEADKEAKRCKRQKVIEINRESLTNCIKNNLSLKLAANDIGVSAWIFSKRIKSLLDVSTWDEAVVIAHSNHKITSIEKHIIVETGDLTVDGYENFATDTIIVHNSRYCLAGDTNIAVNHPDERKTIKDIVEDFENGTLDYGVFSIKDKNIVFGEIERAWCTGEREIWEITLDDENIIRCTDNHPFMLRNGEYKRADELIASDALMPFRRSIANVRDTRKTNDFELVYDLTIKDHHNFALTDKIGQGIVFVHNSDFQEMEYCLAGDTKISVPDGYKTLEELCNEYGTNKEFVVYSYDHNLKRIVPAIAKQARQTCVEEGFKVTFDTGKSLTGTGNHRLMLKDGSYRRIDELQVNDAMMPFYRKDLYTPGKDKNNNYRFLNTQDKNIGRGGWISEHKYIAEWAACRELKENEVVHHINFKKYDNNPNNLQIMTNEDHLRYHVEILNGAKWSSDNSAWIETFKKNHSLWMKNNNPAQRKDITFGRILEICEREGFNQVKLCKVLDTDPNVIKRHLRKNGFNNFEIFAKAYDKTWVNSSWNNAGNKNPRYRSDITYQKICNTFLSGKSIKEISASLNTTTTIVNNRIKTAGFKSFNEFAESYTNHKVVSIESIGKIPMFDITVDGYKNFATDSIISHNTPEIASALDIYSEECISPDEKGNTVHIYSENVVINRLLGELFYDTLNVNFNMSSWVRNMCKYGDMFLFNDVSPEHGVINVFPISVNEIEREEGFDKQDPMAVRYRWITQGNQVLQNWQVSHFRLLGNDAFLPYGTSVLEAARRIWRQLILIEDAMLVYRVVRSPDRRVFYIDVGNVPPEDIANYMEQAQTSLRKNQVVDKTTGRVDLRYNPLCNSLKTFIKLQDGRTITLGELIEEWEAGKQDQYVYSVDLENKQLAPGKIVWAGITRKNAELVRVHIDDGSFLDCTPDHRFMLRDGSYKEASKLKQNETLMPLYTRHTSKEDGYKMIGYETIYDPFSQSYVVTHRNNVIATQGFDAIKGKVIHHKDFNKLNNNPDNLQPMSSSAHNRLHGDEVTSYNKSLSGRRNSKNRMKKTWANGNINSSMFVEIWKNEAIRKNRIEKLSLKTNEKFVGHLFRIMDNLNTGLSTREGDFLNAINNDIEFVTYLLDLNPEFKNGFANKLTRGSLQCQLKSFGFTKSLSSFKRAWVSNKVNIDEIIKFCKENTTVTRKDILEKFKINRTSYNYLVRKACRSESEFTIKHMPAGVRFLKNEATSVYSGYKNHRVSSVEILSYREDTGCITVEKYHNFAASGYKEDDKTCSQSFVMLHNSVDEDYFIPVRGAASGTKIEPLAGGTNAAAIEDVQYIQKKLFSALKIPKAYLGYDEGLGAKATLSQEDIRFSRSINRIQRTLISELNKLAIIHLYCNGFEGHDLLDFEIKLTNPSTIAQQQKLELFTTKFTIAASANQVEGMVDKKWIRKNIFSMTDEEIDSITRGLFEDKELSLRLEAVKLPELKSEETDDAKVPEETKPEQEPPAETESPLGNLDFGEEKVNASHDLGLSGDDILDEDDFIQARIMKSLKGLPVMPKSQTTHTVGRGLLDEKTGSGTNFVQRDLYNKKRRKGTKKGMNVNHADLVGVDKDDPRDSIAHPFGNKADLINPLKNAHKIKIDETDGNFINNFLNKNIDITENRMSEVDSLIKSLRTRSSVSSNTTEEK